MGSSPRRYRSRITTRRGIDPGVKKRPTVNSSSLGDAERANETVERFVEVGDGKLDGHRHHCLAKGGTLTYTSLMKAEVDWTV
jgi:hypothetical protein